MKLTPENSDSSDCPDVARLDALEPREDVPDYIKASRIEAQERLRAVRERRAREADVRPGVDQLSGSPRADAQDD